MAFARAALDEFRRAKIWAALDLHNNTGRNPLYAAVFRSGRRAASARLAAGFSGVVVETEMPRGTCMEALSELAPAATLEWRRFRRAGGDCARGGFYGGGFWRANHCRKVRRKRFCGRPRKFRLPSRHSVVFGEPSPRADIAISAGVERWNFKELRDGFVFARLREGVSASGRFPVLDASGADVFGRYFTLDGGKIRAARPFIPAMLTVDEKAARDDCLCYIMEAG